MAYGFLWKGTTSSRHVDWAGSRLSEYFAGDFSKFGSERLSAVLNNDSHLMFDLRRGHGEQVKKIRIANIAKALMEVTNTDVTWPDDHRYSSQL